MRFKRVLWAWSCSSSLLVSVAWVSSFFFLLLFFISFCWLAVTMILTIVWVFPCEAPKCNCQKLGIRVLIYIYLSSLTHGGGGVWKGVDGQGVILCDLAAVSQSFSQPAVSRSWTMSCPRDTYCRQGDSKIKLCSDVGMYVCRACYASSPLVYERNCMPDMVETKVVRYL